MYLLDVLLCYLYVAYLFGLDQSMDYIFVLDMKKLNPILAWFSLSLNLNSYIKVSLFRQTITSSSLNMNLGCAPVFLWIILHKVITITHRKNKVTYQNLRAPTDRKYSFYIFIIIYNE